MMEDNFSLTVTGEETPDESILLSCLQEALQKGTKKVNIINGYVIDTDSSVQLSLGPVLGEISSSHAIVLIEVIAKESVVPICAKLYKEDEKGEPLMTLEKEARVKRPTVFQFEDLEPDTKYTGK